MILKFPDLDTLRLALVTGAVPPAVTHSPVSAGFDDQGAVWAETAAKLSTAALNELRKLGVSTAKNGGVPTTAQAGSWLELLPLRPDAAVPQSLETQPVLFDVAGGSAFSRLVLEVLRLGNDRMTYRWLSESDAKGEGRALLRVIGPPYYSLLRAIDRIGQQPPTAYVEKAPRVWVQVGHAHPLAEQVKPPEGKIVLMRPPRTWELLPDAPFNDIYGVLEFQLPDVAVPYQDGELSKRLPVRLALRPGGAPEGAELWVLRDRAVEELNCFVQNADDQLLHRLNFAVGESEGKTVIVLQVKQAQRQTPPVLVLPG